MNHMQIGRTITTAVGVALLSAAAATAAPRSLNDLSGPWQLFVDDYLVAERQGLERVWHAFEKYAGNPVMRATEPWEEDMVATTPGTVLPMEDGTGFRLWYPFQTPEIDPHGRTGYATSTDGIHWVKPRLGIVTWPPPPAPGGNKDNNLVDVAKSVIHTPFNDDPNKQYLTVSGGSRHAAWSPDALHWTMVSEKSVLPEGGDVSRFMWDPHSGEFRGYVKIIRNVSGLRRRCVGYAATRDVLHWPKLELILAPDEYDDRWVDEGSIQRTHFYGMCPFAYESMYVAILWIFRATDSEGYFHGPNYAEIITSRDGIRWRRQDPPRTPMLDVGPDGTWDDGQIYTTPNVVRKGDKLVVFYGGANETHGAPKRLKMTCSLGMATLRKDGFASLDAGTTTGTLTTKRLRGTRGRLRVNCDAKGGWVKVEVLDAAGNVLPGYGRDACFPIEGDNLDAVVTWHDKEALPDSAGPIRLRFLVHEASLYSFTAGDTVEVLEEEPSDAPLLAVLVTSEGDVARRIKDNLTDDGAQDIILRGLFKVDQNAAHAAFGKRSVPLGSRFCPLSALELGGTRALGTQFTLALMACSTDNEHARLFSSYDDMGAVRPSELVFDADPSGRVLPGLRLICKGIEVYSDTVRFDDGKYHHLAVTYDDGLIRFYLDGRPVGEGRVPPGEPISMRHNLCVGEDTAHGWEQQLRGNVDDILVLGRVLSADEIETLKTRGAKEFFAK